MDKKTTFIQWILFMSITIIISVIIGTSLAKFKNTENEINRLKNEVSAIENQLQEKDSINQSTPKD